MFWNESFLIIFLVIGIVKLKLLRSSKLQFKPFPSYPKPGVLFSISTWILLNSVWFSCCSTAIYFTYNTVAYLQLCCISINIILYFHVQLKYYILYLSWVTIDTILEQFIRVTVLAETNHCMLVHRLCVVGSCFLFTFIS